MKAAAVALLSVAPFILISLTPDPYEAQWHLVAYMIVAALAYLSLSFFRLPLVAMGAYLAVRAVYGASESHGLSTEVWLTTSVLSLRHTAFLIAAVLAGALAGRRPEGIFSWAVPMAACATIAGMPLLGFNTSLNAALLVAGLPFVVREFRGLDLVTAPVPVLVVVLFFQSGLTAPAMLAAWFALTFRRGWLASVGAACAYIAWKSATNPGVFTGKTDRLEIYRLTWQHFREHVDPLLGAGLSSFVAYGPYIGRGASRTDLWWLSLHSDWMQLGFELGAVGLALGLWLYADALLRADAQTRTALLLLGIAGVGYFPMAVPVMAVYSAWLVARTQTRGGPP